MFVREGHYESMMAIIYAHWRIIIKDEQRLQKGIKDYSQLSTIYIICVV